MTSTPVTSVLLIDARIQSYQTIVDSVKEDVRYIVYDVENTSYPSIIAYIKAKIAELNITSFTSIGIVEYNENRTHYHMFGPHTQPALITSVVISEPNLESWTHVKEFISYLKTTYSIQHYDMLACALYVSQDWKYIIDTLSSITGVQVRASTDKTGATILGGDWILESTGTDIDLKTVYFNENIENFDEVLDITGTVTNTIPAPFIPGYASGNGEFLWPYACRIYNNRIYVADNGNGRIQILDLSLNYITHFSVYDPNDLAIHPTNGRIYISGGHRINAYDASFNYLFQTQAISYVRAVALDLSGNVYASSGQAILKFDGSCNYIGSFLSTTGSGNGQISNVTGMVFDSSNNLWISDEGPWDTASNHRIQKFDINGNFLFTFGSFGTGNDNFNIPVRPTFDSQGNIYVADARNDLVKKFTNTGTFLMSFGGNTPPSNNNRFSAGLLDWPLGVAVDSSDNVYVIENYNHRLQKFSPAGVSLATRGALWVGSGSDPGRFNLPWGIAVHPPNGNVYVVDKDNHRVQKFDSSFSLIWTLGSYGSGNSSFNLPRRIAIDTSENIYVTDTGNHAVKVFNSSGTYLRSIGLGYGGGNGQLYIPLCIAVDTSFNVYISDNNWRIQLFDAAGNYVHTYDVGRHVRGMSLDSNRNIYVTSTTNVTNVYKYSSAIAGSISPILTLTDQGININDIAVDYNTGNFITVQESNTPRFKLYNPAGTLIFSSNLSVYISHGVFLYNNSNTLVYADTYSHRIVKATITVPLSPTYQSIAQVTKTFGIDASFSLTAVMAGVSNSDGAYTFSSSDASAVSVSGAVATINAYTPSAITITATQAASGNYSASSTTFTVLVSRGTPTYQSIAQVTKTFGIDASFSLTAVMSGISNSDGAYTFSSSDASAVSVSGAVAIINAYTPSAITITASQDASGNYNASSTTFTVLVNRGAPTYQSIAQVTKTFGIDASFSLTDVMSGVSNSDGAYTFSSSDASAVSIAGAVATINAYTPSAITITASQDASGNYAASSTTFTVLVNRGAPTYQSIAQVTKTFGIDASFSLTAVMAGVSNSDGAYTFSSSDASAVSIAGAVATINAYTPSAITITASQDASGNYAASSTTFTVLVNRKTPSYGSFSIPAATYGDASFSIAPYAPTTDSIDVPFVYTSSAPEVATISSDGTVVTVIGQGYTTITASQDASGNYTAGNTTTSFLVNRAAPTFLRAFTIPNKTFGVDVSFSLLALTDGLDNTDGTYHFTSSNSEIVSISGDGITATILSYTPTTPVTIYVAIDACGNYAASSTSGTVTIARGSPTYQSISQVTKTFGDAAFSLADIVAGVSNSNGAYTFTSSDASAVSIGGVNNDTATILAYTPTAITITASQAASGNYAASSTTFSVLVNRNTPTLGALTLGSLNGYYDVSDVFFALTAPTSNSSGAFTYESSNTSVAVIADASFGTANLIARYDPSSLSNMSLSSNNVNELYNLYGSTDYHLTPYYSNPQVVTYNSKTMVNFTSLVGLRRNLPITAELTIMIVLTYNPLNLTVDNYGAIFQHGNRDTDISIIKKAGSTNTFVLVSGYDLTNIAIDLTVNKTYILVGRITGSTKEFWAYSQDGSSNYVTGTSVTISPRSSADFFIGGASSSSKSYIGEVLYYNTSISTADINANLDYLRQKWFNAAPSTKYVRLIGSGNTTITAIQDICGNYSSNSTSALLRVGATVPTLGTFTVSATTKTYGDAPFTLTPPTSNSNGAFTFTSSNSNIISISGTTATIVRGGTVTITASQDPSGSFTRTSVSTSFTVQPITPNLRNWPTFTRSFSEGTFNITPPESDNSGATFRYYAAGYNYGVVAFDNQYSPTVTIRTGGTTTIYVEHIATDNYSSQTITTTVTITPVAPTNSYSNFSRAFDVGTFAIPAPTTNNTGRSITYTSSDTSVATIDGSNAVIHKVGTSIITATIASSQTYNQSDISAVLTVTKGTPTITGLFNTTITMLTTPFIPNALSTSNGTFTYVSDNSGIVMITNNNTINPVSVGTATVTATISEDTSGNYNSRSYSFFVWVHRANSSLSSSTFTPPATMTYGDAPASLVVAPTSTNTSVPIVYSSANTNIATIDPSSGVITAEGAGNVYFIASQAQTAVYNANSLNSSYMTVSRKTVTLTRSAPYTTSTITKYYGDAGFDLTATSESTGSVIYNTNVGGIVSLSNSSGSTTVTIVGVGTVTITASQYGNSRYTTQNDVAWTLTVGKGTTTLFGLAATLTKNVTDVPFYVSATSASSGTKTYALANPADASVLTVNASTGLVTLLGAGTATVVISQAASALYNAPDSVSCVITVNQAGTALQGSTLSSDRVFTNVDMTGASLANTTITSVSFSGATLTNAVMTNATLRNAVMTSATLAGASFASSDISGTNFTSATLTSANMANTVLTNSVMTNAVLTGAALTNANITRTTFTGATVRSANLTGATLTDSTLTSADLSGSILRAANVTGSTFAGAVLANADLSGAVVTNANFTNANIRGANITNVEFSPLQKLQLLKNTNNRDIGGVQVSDVSGTVLLSAISATSAALTIPDISNATIKVVIPTTSTNVADAIPNVTLDTTTSDKFYFPINTDEYFQIEGVKYYVSDGVIKRQSDDVAVSVVTYGSRRIWLIAGSVIASVLQTNTISSSTFTVPSYKLDSDAPFSITVAPTSNSPAPIVYSSNNPSVATIDPSSGVITIHKQGYVNFIASQAETELYEDGSKTSNELFVNKLINFTLTGLNQSILMNALASLDASAVSLESTDAIAVYYVKQSDMMNVFKFQSDSNDMNEDAASDVKYYVFDRNWPAELKINPLHAMMNKTESANMLGNAETFAANKMLVKHDFVRYLSLRLFNTIHGVDLFKNEMDLMENAVYGGETNRNTIHELLGNVSTTSSDESMSYDVSGNKYLTNDASGNTNLCRELLRQMVAGAPARFGVITDVNTPQSLPFEPDDTINFKLTLQAAPMQNLLTGVTEVPSRSYLVKLVIKSSVTGGDANTAVVDSEMYPNAYPYSSSVVSYAPTSASSSVYNSYSPPAPIPFSRFGFNGWYYANSSAWVNVAPAVRNHVKWLVPANSAGVSTVGGLQYIRVNLKIHNKTALPYLMVYTQTGSYRKYAVSGGSGALTNGTKYTFYMNFNSYTREPAVVGYTNAVLTNTVGAGSFASNEIVSSIALETDSNATAGTVEFTLAGMIVGDATGEKEYGFLADVPAAYP